MQQKRGILQYKNGFSFNLAENRLEDPFKWKEPRLVFVNSMSDLFHEDIPTTYLKAVFEVMNNCPMHIFQILTKRIERVQRLCEGLTWSSNIWLGISVENNHAAAKIEVLRSIPASTRFISFEPLLEDLNQMNLHDIDWVIVGGESGGKARIIKPRWVGKIRIQCEKEKVPFFFKQWGKRIFNPDKDDPTLNRNHPFHSKGGCMLQGKIVRQFPTTKVRINEKRKL